MAYSEVVVGVDFSSASFAAVLVAQVFTGGRGRLSLVHVVRTKALDQVTYAGMAEPFYAHRESWADSRLIDVAREAPGSEDLSVDVVVRRGQPSDEIVGTASRLGADLVVVGACGGHRLSSCVARRVAREAAAPVLVVPAGSRARPPDRVLIAVDHDHASFVAAREGVRVARALGVPTEVVHVVETGSLVGEPGAHGLCDDPALGDLPVPAERVHVVRGDPADEILRLARPRDLVLCATRGRGTLARLALGSVAAQLTCRARCPVLVVPPRVAARLEACLAPEAGTSEP